MKKTTSKTRPSQAAGPPDPEERLIHKTGIDLFKEDLRIIYDARTKALNAGHVISMGETIRMLIRRADLNSLSIQDFEAATADDRRRKAKE